MVPDDLSFPPLSNLTSTLGHCLPISFTTFPCFCKLWAWVLCLTTTPESCRICVFLASYKTHNITNAYDIEHTSFNTIFTVLRKYFSLPHELGLQLTDSSFFPVQLLPPSEGCGLSHSLVLDLVQSLFFRIHLPSGLQRPHAPLTSHNIMCLKLSFNNWFFFKFITFFQCFNGIICLTNLDRQTHCSFLLYCQLKSL